MVSDSHVVNFPLKHQQKDMAFAVDMAHSLGAPVGVAEAANEHYKKVRGRGLCVMSDLPYRGIVVSQYKPLAAYNTRWWAWPRPPTSTTKWWDWVPVLSIMRGYARALAD
jgi:hypothetical protein